MHLEHTCTGVCGGRTTQSARSIFRVQVNRENRQAQRHEACRLLMDAVCPSPASAQNGAQGITSGVLCEKCVSSTTTKLQSVARIRKCACVVWTNNHAPSETGRCNERETMTQASLQTPGLSASTSQFGDPDCCKCQSLTVQILCCGANSHDTCNKKPRQLSAEGWSVRSGHRCPKSWMTWLVVLVT